MDLAELFGAGIPGHFQPGVTQFRAQTDQASGYRAKVHWQRQLDVEQHWHQGFVNSFRALLKQFVDPEAVKDRKSQ